MTTTGAGGSARVDSMSLLRQIYDEALEPEYALARARSARPRRRGSTGAVWAVVLLLFGVAVATTWLDVRRSSPEALGARAQLVAQVGEQTRANDRLAATVDRQQAALAALQNRALAQTLEGAGLTRSVAALEQAAGLSSVSGPGLRVQLSDGPPAVTQPGGPDLARVLDQDIRQAVNGLFAAGAQAVAVNGQRVTSLTSVRSAGGAVLVDYRPLTPPYEIVAAGDPATMAARFAEGADAADLRGLADAYGIGFDVTSLDQVTVPAATGVTLRYARVKGEQR